MIYVKRDPSLIPEKVLQVALRAQIELEHLPLVERVAFIKKKAHVWRAFKKYLSKMSYGKCWYSEGNDPQSFFDVDHFRPKAEARRSENEIDDGYPWLAFDWDNFRYSTGRSNKLSTDEDTAEVLGKASWFPLMAGSPKAFWDNRCVDDERPLLLDPTRKQDMALIEVGADGRISPSRFCVGSNKLRVAESIKRYGLDLPNLTEARRTVMRDVNERVELFYAHLGLATENEQVADKLMIEYEVEAITNLTLPNRPYALAARSKLIELGLADLVAKPEVVPALAM